MEMVDLQGSIWKLEVGSLRGLMVKETTFRSFTILPAR